MIYSFKLVPVTIRDAFLDLVASKLRLTIYCLLPAMYAISRCDSISSFSHTGKITTFQTLKNKQNKLQLTNTIDFMNFPHSLKKARLLFYTSFTTNFICFSQLVLVLHLRRALMFSINICLMFYLNFTSFIKNIKYNIGKSFYTHKIFLYVKQFFPHDKKFTKMLFF